MILDIITRSQKEYGALGKGIEILDNGINDVTKDKMFKNLMVIIQMQSKDLLNLSYLSLIYMQGSNFDIDVARMLIKLGKGGEALEAMFKNKMDGNG